MVPRSTFNLNAKGKNIAKLALVPRLASRCERSEIHIVATLYNLTFS